MKPYILTTLVAALALTACTDDLEQPYAPDEARGELRTLALTTRVVDETPALEAPATRATVNDPTIKEDEITDLFVLEYDAQGDLMGSPQPIEYGNDMQVSLLLPEEGTTYQAIAIANTHEPGLQSTLAACTTLDALRALAHSKRLGTEDDLFQKTVSEDGTTVTARRLLMSAIAEVTSETTAINFDFYRNVAKLTLNISNANSSGVDITSVQLRSVPDRIFFAEQLRSGENLLYPTEAEKVNFIDYEVVKNPTGTPDVTGEGGTATADTYQFIYYLPRNSRGTSPSSSYQDKSKPEYVPKNATYVEIWGTKTAEGTPVRYRFYLGENMKNDYNVINNHHYTLSVTISGTGNEQDARVTDYSVEDLDPANCYIVTPIDNDRQTIYKIPATERSNAFWGNAHIGNSAYVLNKGQRWVAEVIWQDVPNQQLIEFCTPGGNVWTEALGSDDVEVKDAADSPVAVTRKYFYSTTTGDLCFKPKRGAKGNVVIGIKYIAGSTPEKVTEYVWSWHLWITDYQPGQAEELSWQEGKYIYQVEGGEVHRYDDHESTAAANKVWAEDKPQYGKFMMDRNLGAMSANREDGYTRTGGFFYQYGRKDPFPRLDNTLTSVVVYDILGNEKTGVFKVADSETTTDFATAVKNPTTFYKVTSGDWYGKNNTGSDAEKNPYTSNYWNDPDVTGTSAPYTKSLFDPSPSGWKLPQNYTWSVFGSNGSSGTPRFRGEFNNGTVTGGYYFYISNAEGDDAPVAWYPASGYRLVSNGNLGSAGGGGYCWSASPDGATHGRSLYFNSSNVYPQSSSSRGSGFPVRPLQE